MKELVTYLQNFDQGVKAQKVFTDYVQLHAIAIHNAFYSGTTATELEDRYNNIISTYKGNATEKFAELAGMVISKLDKKPFCDILGQLYMESDQGNKFAGQFFTPNEVNEISASLCIDYNKELKNKDIITVDEPSCGSGGMLLASAKRMSKLGINPQRRMRFHAMDIDFTCVCMCYIQMSLNGIYGIVELGNTLTNEVSMILHTPRLLIN